LKHFSGLRRLFRASARRRGERERGLRGGFEPGFARGRAPLAGDEKPMIAIELAHDFDHPINRLKIAPRHGAVGHEHCLVETAHLKGEKLCRRLRHAAGENVANNRAHTLLGHAVTRRNLGDRTPRLRKLTILCSRLTLMSRAARRAWIERSRDGARGAVSVVSDISCFSVLAREQI
jgi:hypothetical protein